MQDSHDDGPGPLSSEEFLFHMYRGAELLDQNRVHEAKEEIEGALRLQPSDPKGQDLMAVSYFRMGMYPRAIVLYEDLVARFPDHLTPRVNLSLCYLKTGQPDRALEHLQLVVEKDPRHERAWAYLGLVHQRRNDYDNARVCFERAGNKRMVRRMIDLATGDPQAVLRLAAAEAFHELDMGELEFSIASDDPAADHGTWESPEHAPPQAQPTPARNLLPPLSFEQRVTPSGTGFVVRADQGLAVRLDRVVAFAGKSPTVDASALPRRSRGRIQDLPVGSAARPLMIVSEATGFVLEPSEGRVLRELTLQDDIVCVREDLLVALDLSLDYENGRLPSGACDSIGMVRLRGSGLAIADFPRQHRAMGVEASVLARCRSVLGWTGRLVPRIADGEFVAFSGEGSLWIGYG